MLHIFVITKAVYFSLLFSFSGTVKAAVLDGGLDLPGTVSVLVYEIRFILMCCNAIKWVNKTGQVYDLETKMVYYAHFLHLHVNDS